MKRFLALLLACIMCVTLVACGGGSTATPTPAADPTDAPATDPTDAPAADPTDEPTDEPTKENPVIAFVPKVTNQAWWEYVGVGVSEWADENGIDVIWKGPTEVDSAAQVQILTDMVAQDVDILCLSPIDPAACEAVLKEAKDKGIIVIATEAATMKNVDYDIEAFSEAGLGAFMMDELAAMMGEEGEYITMVGSVTMESQNNWADAGVARAEEAYPDLTLIEADARVESNSDAEIAYQVTKEMIKKYPNLKGILGTGSFDAPGAARAIEELGLQGKVFAISVAIPSEVSHYLKNGSLTSVALWDPAIAAKTMLNVGMKLWNGETIETGADLGTEGYSNVTVDGTLIMGEGWIAITADNVDSFTF